MVTELEQEQGQVQVFKICLSASKLSAEAYVSKQSDLVGRREGAIKTATTTH